MRLVFLLLGLVSIAAASFKCYDGFREWGRPSKAGNFHLISCPEQCCMIIKSIKQQKTVYTCGEGCPKANEFVNGEKCVQAEGDPAKCEKDLPSWCFCDGIIGQCDPQI